jgi:hypothetical protein
MIEKFKNVIIIPPCHTYGDTLSMIGMVYFLLNHYDNVYLNVGQQKDVELYEYFNNFFINDLNYNKHIFLTNNIDSLLNNGDYSDFHFINVFTGEWDSASFLYFNHPKVDKKFYFNDLNPLYNQIDFGDSYKLVPNKHLPPDGLNINHLFYYELVGLNNNVRMDFFHYERNLNEEEQFKKTILNNNGLTEFDKYNIINNPNGDGDRILNKINNEYKTINIHNISNMPGELLSLLEGAESIHFVEGSNVNFFYHCNYKNIFEYDKQIYFHVWCRNRNWPQYKLDYAYRMMQTPQLNNWVFLLNENEF